MGTSEEDDWKTDMVKKEILNEKKKSLEKCIKSSHKPAPSLISVSVKQ